jgi:hypothetical protein
MIASTRRAATVAFALTAMILPAGAFDNGYNSSMAVSVAPDYGDHDRIITMGHKDDCKTLLGNPLMKIDETVWRWKPTRPQGPGKYRRKKSSVVTLSARL